MLRAARLPRDSSAPEELDKILSACLPVCLLAGIFVLDFSQPAEVVFSLLYVLPIISTIRIGHPSAAYLVFLVASVATVAAAAFGVPATQSAAALTNRALALVAQVVAAETVIQYLRRQEESAASETRPWWLSAGEELAQVAAVIESVPTAIALLRLDGSVYRANEAARNLLGLSGERIGGKHWISMLPFLALTKVNGATLALPPELQDWPRSGPDALSCEVLQRGAGGAVPKRFAVSGAVLRDRTGFSYGALVIAQDVSAAQLRERERDAFISMAAHELRAPLSTLRGYAQLAQMHAESAGNITAAAALQKALRQADRLNRMITELLDIARLERGQIDLHCTPTDLGALLCEAVEHRRAAHPERTLTVTTCDPLPLLELDAPRLQQVFANLLDNAIKYSPDGGPVDVLLRKAGAFVEISVTDHGIGIPEEEQAQLFQQFYRGSSGARRANGLGVGLYISNQIALRHGGHLRVRSAHGEGSTFTCVLPLKAPEVAPTRP